MIEMNNALQMNRLDQVAPVGTEMPQRSDALPPAGAPSEQTVPGVQVQISTAAREAAANDRLPPATDPTRDSAPTASQTQEGSSSARQSAEQAGGAARNDSNTRQDAAQGMSYSQSQAIQMFNKTAGIGVEQPEPSALRTT
ncbi:MAG: hypothetical protein RBT55_12955 [Rhodocyclaceae bacterium]|jgi:hypothetical protein|nr:hypothetical protein [Rhodocyclaceae bacterium]